MTRTNLLLLLLALAWLAPLPARAYTTCSVTLGTLLSFGNVAASGNTDAMGTLTVSCSTAALSVLGYARVRLCLNLGAGSAGGDSNSPRIMTNTAGDQLQYQIYKDPARTQVWGALDSSTPNPVVIDLSYQVPLIVGGSQTVSVTMYGRIPANQILSVGAYTSVFSGTYTQLVYSYNESVIGFAAMPDNCTSGGTGYKSINSAFPFNVAVTVPARCNTYVTTDLDFGTIAGNINSAIDQISTISLLCTKNTAWNIGLSNGLNAGDGTRRMRQNGGSDQIKYELYRDSARTRRWGTTLNVDTFSDSGTGTAQTVSVYGRVPAPQTPMAGNYQDTVTVVITY